MTEFQDRAVAALRAAFGLGSDALTVFRRSMEIDYAKWHDGVGYDLDALRRVPAADHGALYPLLTPPGDWRDVEALAALRTPRADDALREAARSSTSNEVRVAVIRTASHLVDDALRIDVLRAAIDTATLSDGLIGALDQVADFHPPPLIDALLRALRARESELAYHFAETLARAFGADTSHAEANLRPVFLRFSTPDLSARERALRELGERLGIPLATND